MQVSPLRTAPPRSGRDDTLERSGENPKPRSESGALVRVDVDCALPGAAGARGRHHGIALLAAEGLAELVEVLHGALDAPLAGGVRVGLGLVDGSLLRLRATPDLGEGDEEA